jgi:hypothetical protein
MTQEPFLAGLGWRLVNVASGLLEHDEREAVTGDLAEAGENSWQSLLDVLGLVVRRQAALWKNWRPWLAAFGLALPSSFLLMGFSLSVSQGYQQFIGPTLLKATGFAVGPGLLLLVCNVLLLVGWSWTGGFVVGSLSRKTVRVSAALSFLPCLFCLARFRVESLSRFCLLLFLLPAVWGACRGLRIAQIKLRSAIVLALGITVLTVPLWSSTGPWIPNWALSWPAWYLVATAWRPISQSRREPHGE